MEEAVTRMMFHRSQVGKIAGVGEFVEVSDLILGVGLHLFPNELGPDEAGTAGDKDAHDIRSLFVLSGPVVGQGGVIVSDTAFVFGVVKAVGGIDQRARGRADDFVTMSNAGRDEDPPGPLFPNIEGVFGAEGGGIEPHVDEGYLEHAGDGRPEIGLVPVEVERLDDAGVAYNGRNLSSLG